MNYFLIGVCFLISGALSQEETTSSPPQRIIEIIFDAEEPGSGDQETLPECKMSYIMYDKMYLRGVMEPNYISYNGTTLEECKKKCCYETKLECRSFSFLEILNQCFIMNVTQHYRKVGLEYTSGHIHVELVDTDTTAAPTTTTTLPFPSPAWTTRRISTSTTTTRRNGGFPNIFEPTDAPGKITSEDCQLRCVNGGRCVKRQLNDGVASIELLCECKKGFVGDKCEKKVSAAGGFPVWLIALIVLGGIILILFLTVCIMYHIYRKKTGEYKVVKAIQKWTRRGKRPRTSGSTDDFVNPEDGHHTSPTTSVQSIHGSVTSSATHSTTTSV